MLKISWSPTGKDRLNSLFLRPFSYSLQRCLCWQDRQSTGGCQSALVDKLGVSPSQYHHTMVHITITRGWTISPSRPQFWDTSLTPIITNLSTKNLSVVYTIRVHYEEDPPPPRLSHISSPKILRLNGFRRKLVDYLELTLQVSRQIDLKSESSISSKKAVHCKKCTSRKIHKFYLKHLFIWRMQQYLILVK
jgi:hypothetical protein